MRYALLIAVLAAGACVSSAAEQPAGWKAGTARVVITPEEPMYLAGFGDRVVPAEGTALDLYTKALAIEDGEGRRFVLVTMDLIDVPRQLRDALERRGGRRSRALLNDDPDALDYVRNVQSL